MSESLEKYVVSTRSELNAVFLAGVCLDWAWKAALAGLAVALPLRLLGMGWQGVALWLAALCAAVFAGYLRGLPRRLNSAQTARWLDERLGSRELLSAALVCLRHESPGPYDAEILESADIFVSEAPRVRPPAAPILRKSAWVGALCLACLVVLSLAGPASGGPGGTRQPGSLEDADAISRLLGRQSAQAREFGTADAKELAKELFPADKRMASLAERALRDGRMDDLRKLLGRAVEVLEKQEAKAKSALERQAAAEERLAFENLVQRRLGNEGEKEPGAEGQKGGEAGKEDGAGGGGQTGAGDQAGQGQSGAERGSPDSPGAQEGEGQAQGQPGGERGGAGKGEKGDSSRDSPGGVASGSNAAGKGLSSGVGAGHSDELMLKDGKLKPKAGAGKLDLGKTEDESMNEMVLPGTKAAADPATATLSAERSSESVVSRKDLPLEYREFSQSYFLRLTEGEGK
jgi:hypothetical protein